ncbi:Nf1 [Bugula neritina]|uniref:Nf1 n=1 Tax=Bugula neritina TaxID=10212 RepID=A0A7J7JHT4_BUGNE|nr:Nf1 [Bugula neritina]
MNLQSHLFFVVPKFQNGISYYSLKSKEEIGSLASPHYAACNCAQVSGEITHTESGTLSSAQHVKKKQFVDELRKAVNPQNYKLALMEGAVTACVRMCKAFTYVKSTESSSVLLTLVKSVVLDLKAVLFNPSKPFKTSSPKEDIELMIDCFVSFYRTTPHCYEVLKVVLSICLNQSAPTQYHFLLVRGLLKIINQKKISWWPKIDMVYSEGPQLRKMFSDTMQSVTMTMNPSRVSLHR